MLRTVEPTLRLEERLLPAITRMSLAGVPVDYEAWAAAAVECEAGIVDIENRLLEVVPTKPGSEPVWNIDSPSGAKELLHACGLEVVDTSAKTLKHHTNEPVVSALMSYRKAKKAQDAHDMKRFKDQIARLSPEPPSTAETWNFRSPHQVKEIALLLGYELSGTDALELLRHKDDHEFFRLIAEHRRLSKLASTYGVSWFKDSYHEGRVYPTWWQVGTTTGRMACSSPNLQQLPNDGPYRSCVRSPEGRAFVIADYSQIELRIAAKLAPDESMLKTFRDGNVDIHTETARILTGKKNPTKEERTKAKTVNFGLLYGMHERSLPNYALKEYGIKMTTKEASTFYRKYFGVRKGLKRWHARLNKEFRAHEKVLSMRTLTGRIRRDIQSLNEVLNHPVQGTGADGLKLALVLLHEDCERFPTAVPIIAAHDEIVYECDEADADEVRMWIEETMKEAMHKVVNGTRPDVPIEVEGVVSKEWTKP